MAIVTPSRGYPGSLTADPGTWSRMQQVLGTRYCVLTAASLIATPVAAGTRQVQLSAGFFGGQGVLDENDGPSGNAVITLPTVATGTQWFMIVARRTYGVTNATTFVALPGPVQAAVPTSLAGFTVQHSVGVVDDQPLWLVPLTAGDTVPGAPIDLRIIGSERGCPQANHALVLQYATWEGFEVAIGDVRWRRSSTTNGSASWTSTSNDPTAKRTLQAVTANFLSSAAGWVSNNPTTLRNRAVRDGNHVDLWLEFRKASGASIIPTSPGNFPDTVIATLVPAWCPTTDTPFTFLYRGGLSTTNTAIVGGSGLLLKTGDLRIIGAAGDYRINNETTLNSVQAHLSFTQES